METDNNRKREREMESVQELPQAKLSRTDDSDGFSDDSFEFEINLASQKSQYNLSQGCEFCDLRKPCFFDNFYSIENSNGKYRD